MSQLLSAVKKKAQDDLEQQLQSGQSYVGANRAPDTPSKQQPDPKQRKAGSPNGDGTFYGGGNGSMICSACAKAGMPKDVAFGHRCTHVKRCPLLQNKQSAQIDPKVSKIADEALDNDKATTIPEQASVVIEDSLSPDEVLEQIMEGEIPAKQAKLWLLKAMRGASAEERELLQSYINNVDGLVPGKTTATKTKTGFHTIGLGHGKLVRLYMLCKHHVRSDLHLKSSNPEHRQTPQFDIATQSLTLSIKPDEAANTLAVFHLAMVHFRHAVLQGPPV
jgi:hypothetical protein